MTMYVFSMERLEGKKSQNLWCDVVTLFAIEEVVDRAGNLQKSEVLLENIRLKE